MLASSVGNALVVCDRLPSSSVVGSLIRRVFEGNAEEPPSFDVDASGWRALARRVLGDLLVSITSSSKVLGARSTTFGSGAISREPVPSDSSCFKINLSTCSSEAKCLLAQERK